jgi:hypothetical protein
MSVAGTTRSKGTFVVLQAETPLFQGFPALVSGEKIILFLVRDILITSTVRFVVFFF